MTFTNAHRARVTARRCEQLPPTERSDGGRSVPVAILKEFAFNAWDPAAIPREQWTERMYFIAWLANRDYTHRYDRDLGDAAHSR